MFRGWQCGTLTKSDRDGTKAVPFDVSVRTLGLHVTLGNTAKGFCVRHTEERRAELKTALQEVLDKKTIEPKQAERLRGRMQRFEGYAFGRVAQYSLKVLGELSLKRQKQVPLKDKEMQAGAYLIQRVSEARAIDIGPVSHFYRWGMRGRFLSHRQCGGRFGRALWTLHSALLFRGTN